MNYCTQRNLPCYQNAQRWYYVNSLQKSKSPNPLIRRRYLALARYYTNGKIRL